MSLSLILASFLLSGAAAGEIASELDAIAASHYPATEPGAAVLVMKDGEVLLRKGYGLADRFTHCGEDAIQLAKTDLGWPGWKIIAMADTQRIEGCNPP